MNTFRPALTLLIIALLLPAAAIASNGEDVKDTIKRSFRVDEGGTLYVDVDRGNLVVEASTDGRVHVEMEREVLRDDESEIKSILARHEWVIEQDDDNVIIESRYNTDDEDFWSPKRWRSGSILRISMTVRVPEKYNVEFNTGAGNVSISDLEGEIEGRTGAGNIVVGEVTGEVEIRSGSGNIDIDGVDGTVRVNSGAGNITLGYVTGEIRANTGAGNVTARITEQPDDDSLLESGAGNVTVYLEAGIGLDVDARAAVGSASCDFGLEIEGKWMTKSFEGDVNGGGPDLTIRSGVGNVSLRRM